MKKLLAALCICALVMVCIFVLPTRAEASAEQMQTGSIFQVNPLYGDCVVQQRLAAGSTVEPDIYYTTEQAVIEQMRSGMEDRKATIVVGYRGTADVNAMAHNMLENVFEHTGVPTHGDYLRWHYKTYNISWSSNPVTQKCVFTCQMTYSSTAAQETAVDKAVDVLLDTLNVYTASDYGKVSAIYDYMCENITYDTYGLSIGDDCVYTAYAALIKKAAVCQGYANLFYRLALELGVDARLIPGFGNGGPHAWNIVKLGKYYYNLDATWDAGSRQNGQTYTYFLKAPWDFSDHFRNDEYETLEFHRDYPMDNNNYVVQDDPVIDQMDPNPTLVKIGSAWKCVANGKLYTANTLIKYNGNWYHVNNGVWVRDTGLVNYNGKFYYVKSGLWDETTTSLVKHTDGSWVYVKNGVQDMSNTLINYNGKYYHVNGGVWVKDTTLVKYNGNWLYVKGGVYTKATTFVKFNGSTYYVVNGQWSKATTSLIKLSNGSYAYIKGGVQNMSNTLVKYNGKYYHVNGGVWVKDTTLVKYDGRWLYVKGGVFTNATTFVKYNGNTYYVVNGVWSKTTTGLIKLSNGSYAYIKNGVQDMSNTLINFNGNWYHVSGGKWVRDTTLVSRNGNTYYVKNGLVDFSFTGKFVHNGGAYNIVKGVVK